MGIFDGKYDALSYALIFDGNLPVINELRDGPHRGALQYALLNFKDVLYDNSLSIFGVCTILFPYDGNAKDVNWSANINKILGGFCCVIV